MSQLDVLAPAYAAVVGGTLPVAEKELSARLSFCQTLPGSSLLWIPWGTGLWVL